MEKYAVYQTEKCLNGDKKCSCGGILEIKGNIICCSLNGSKCKEEDVKYRKK